MDGNTADTAAIVDYENRFLQLGGLYCCAPACRTTADHHKIITAHICFPLLTIFQNG
jgi:hypothetical protein